MEFKIIDIDHSWHGDEGKKELIAALEQGWEIISSVGDQYTFQYVLKRV